ncbi:MAG: NAD-dependent epimerase/dehydratase family protein [Alphaproteobacteria bacterium]
MTRILICGATGFIGRNLVEHFAARPDCTVTAVAHKRPPFDCPGVTWVQGDLRDSAAVDRVIAGADIVIQAAATTSGAKDITTKPFIHVTDNAVMNSLLLRSAYEHAVKRFVFFSCTVMYPSSDTPVREEDFTGEITDKYFGVGWTKAYVEKMCAFYAGLGRTRHTVIRHSNIYGPYDKFDLEKSHVFGATVTKTMLADDRLEIWGTGEELRDLLHVDDLVGFVDVALARQEAPFGLYNVGSSWAASIRSLVERVVEASGKTLRLEHNLARPTIPFNLVLDCTRAREALGWTPKIGLEDGIARTVAWWRANIDPATLTIKSQAPGQLGPSRAVA